MEKLRRGVDELAISKGDLEGQLSDMLRQYLTCQDKISNLLYENSGLVSECDSLA